MAVELRLLALLLTVSLSSVGSSTPRFRSTAAEHMGAGFKVLRRLGAERKDFTQIEVTARPLLMVEDPADIDTDRVTVEIKAGGEEVWSSERVMEVTGEWEWDIIISFPTSTNNNNNNYITYNIGMI